MNTAKTNFKQFVYINQTTLETNKQQSEQKRITLEKTKVSFAIFWVLGWLAFVLLWPCFIYSLPEKNDFEFVFGYFWMMIYICVLLFNISNYSKRKNYKDVQLMRLQMKINKFNEFMVTEPKNSTMQNIKDDNVQPIKDNIEEQEVPSISLPTKRQLDFSNLAKEKLIQILEVSHIPFLQKDSLYQLGEKANANNIAWNKVPEILIKEVLDKNGITYKLNINKEDMVKLLK